MNKNADDLLKLIKNQYLLEEGNLGKKRQDFNEFYLSFSSNGPLKLLREEDAPTPSYWIVTPQSSHNKVILFFHGGNFNMGSTYGHQDLCQRLSKYTGFSIFSVDYRLAPEHPFPAAVEDCLESYLWLLDEGFQGRDLVISGISGGVIWHFPLFLHSKKWEKNYPSARSACLLLWISHFPLFTNTLRT